MSDTDFDCKNMPLRVATIKPQRKRTVGANTPGLSTVHRCTHVLALSAY